MAGPTGQRSPAMQAYYDKMKADSATIKHNEEAQKKQFGAIGSTQSQMGVSNYDVNNAGKMAAQSATFNGSNWDTMSGVKVNGTHVNHRDATANNPLHVVNANRNGLIQNAVQSGNWTDYNNFEGRQDPLKYDKGAGGNLTQNKNYYADLISSAYDAMAEAQRKGDAASAQSWERSLKERVQDYNNAPGMAVYIPRIHASNKGGQNEYGIMDYDNSYFDSVYNQGSSGFIPHQNTVDRWLGGTYDQNPYISEYLNDSFGRDGTSGRMWYDNPVFKDNDTLLNDVLNINNSYGTPEEQKHRQQINAGALAPRPQANYQPQNDPYAQAQSQIDAQMQAMLDMMEKMRLEAEQKQKEAEQKNDYNRDEAQNANKNASSGDKGSHVFAPGTDIKEGGVGWTQSKNSMNDTLFKYLDEIWKGGF